jgi:hypothetical protein
MLCSRRTLLVKKEEATEGTGEKEKADLKGPQGQVEILGGALTTERGEAEVAVCRCPRGE